MTDFGEITYLPPDPDTARPGRAPLGTWEIRARPDIMRRLRKILPGVQPTRGGAIVVSDTPQTAVELEWIRQRWPLRLKTPTAAVRLRDLAAAQRNLDQTVGEILAGKTVLPNLPEPARPGRPYQVQASDVLLATGRLLCCDEVGTGKSMTGLLTLRVQGALPCVIVCQAPQPIHKQWIRELAKTWPWLTGHIVNQRAPYDPTKLSTRRGGTEVAPDVWVISYSKLDAWAEEFAQWPGGIGTVIFDEVQELRTGPKGEGGRPRLKYVAAARIADAARYTIGLSASPIYNYGTEIFNVAEVIAPGALGTEEEFLREWCTTDPGSGKRIVADPDALGEFLRAEGVMVSRTRKDIGREIPEPVIVEQPCEADPDKIQEYAGNAAELARILLSAETRFADRGQSARLLDLRMRQATGIAKAPYVAEFTRLILESGEPRVMLFGYHHAVYDIWRDQLAEYKPVFYTGEESPKQKQATIDAFTEGDSRVLVMSVRAGAGLDGLQDFCKVAVFGELDWSPEVHRQCYGRLWRELSADGQYQTVIAYFLVADDGSDPVVAQILDIKKMQAEPILRPGAKLYSASDDSIGRARLLAEQVLARHQRRMRAAG